jgi:hypothetical protein
VRAAGRTLSLALAALLAAAGGATAGLADRVGATFGLMAPEFIKAFQPLEGLVVAVEEGVIYLDLGAEAGAQVGQEFTVFRKGEVFHHAFTGKPLGRYEEQLGHGQVRSVQPQFSEAIFVPAPGKVEPRAEDGVRITRGRVKIAITPVLDLTESRADVRRVPYLLATALERSKRFQVIDPLAVSDMFVNSSLHVEEVLARPERAVPAARNLEVTGWMVPVLLERRGVTYLDVTLISAVTGTALFSRRQPLVPSSATEDQRFPWEPRAED